LVLNSYAENCRKDKEEEERMRETMMYFMWGRNGVDELARFHSIVVLVLLVLGLFTGWNGFSIAALALMVYMCFRILSRNKARRHRENQKYRHFSYELVTAWNRLGKRMRQRRDYRFYKCPSCRQHVRVPKGHGKIEITCPKCRESFIRRS
jgi:hypothetical protein